MKKIAICSLSLLMMLAVVFTFYPQNSQNSKNVVAASSSFTDSDFRNEIVEERKIVSEVTLDNDFIGGEILVVLNREATFRFENYSSRSFTGIGIAKVEEITETTAKNVRAQISESALASESTLESKDKVIASNSRSLDVDSFRRILFIELEDKSKENTLKAIRQLEQREDVLSVSTNSIGERLNSPNDPQLNQQWAVNKMQLPQAWAITTGSVNVTVGIIDSGVDANHADLTNRVNRGLSRDFNLASPFIPNAVVDNDGHGTMVAGVVGAQGNNGVGISGVCWRVSLVSLKDGDASPVVAATARAVIFATDNNFDVINISSSLPTNAALTTAINNYQGLVVASAGNLGEKSASFPASLTASNPRVISVGASTENDSRASFSAHSTNVDIFAPGVDIRTTARDNTYITEQGTSFAAPMVTGVVALVISAYPSLSASAVKEQILLSADAAAEGVNGFVGYCVSNGRLNAYRAVVTILHRPITTAQQLSNIRNNPDVNYRLDANINLATFNGGQWTPIPNFTGNLDGNGYTISGLTITVKTVSSSSANFGLFAQNHGTISNFKLSGVNINFSTDHKNTWSNVGAVAGINGGVGTIKNVQVTGNLECNRDYSALGGIAGTNYGTINNCTLGYDGVSASTTLATMLGNGDIGGIAGVSKGEATNDPGIITSSKVYNTKISHWHVNNNRATGGIVGYTYYANISYVGVYRVTVQNTRGNNGGQNIMPSMGIVIGCLENSILWGVVQNSNQLLSNGANTSRIGTTVANWGWAWGGVVWGNCSIRLDYNQVR